MGSRKSKEEKDFLVTVRRKHSDRLSPAPVWVIPRAGKRLFNRKQLRNWRETALSLEFEKQKKKTSGKKYKKKQHHKIKPQIKKYNKKTGLRR
jgi:ribosomal protein L39E